MAEEQKQAQAPGGAPRREGGSGGHGGPRREGGPGGGGPGGPGGRPRGKRQYFRKKKVCKFCRNIALMPFAGSAAGTQAPRPVAAVEAPKA